MQPSDLKRIRKGLGLKQTQLAEALGVHPNTIRKWECGAQNIASPQMLRLALEALESRAAKEGNNEHG